LGEIFSFLKKIPKNGKQIAKVLETIILNKTLMPTICLKDSMLGFLKVYLNECLL
jgi:hypothetical protein